MMSRLCTRVGILVIVVASLLIGSTVLAQGPFAPAANPIDAVLAKLDQIIEMLAPDTPAAGPVTLFTGYAQQHPDFDRSNCVLANIGTATIPLVQLRLVDFQGTIAASAAVENLPSGHRAAVGASPNATSLRCEFSFVGFANDVRANLIVADKVTSQSRVVVDAR